MLATVASVATVATAAGGQPTSIANVMKVQSREGQPLVPCRLWAELATQTEHEETTRACQNRLGATAPSSVSYAAPTSSAT